MFYWYESWSQIKHHKYPFSAIVPTWDNSGTGILDNVCLSQPRSCLPAKQMLLKINSTWYVNVNEKSVVSKKITNWLRDLTTFLCCRHLLTTRRSLSLRYPPIKMDKSDENDGNDGEIILSCWFLLNDETWRKHDRGSKWQRQNGDRLQFLPIRDV